MSWQRLSKTSDRYNQRLLSQTADALNIITVGRVTNVVYDDKSLGGWNAIGNIIYDEVTPIRYVSKKGQLAKPLDPSIKRYPLINELVYIINLPNTDLNNNAAAYQQYYVNTIAIWNHPHHNAFPSDPNNLPPEQQKDYDTTIAGSPRRVLDNDTDIFLGNTFEEKLNIHPLKPYEGDVIVEGRWGNSIRLGSTVPYPQPTPGNQFPLGTPGTPGDPITIIRNGQSSQADNEGWVPIDEDINNDPSSIYLTSTQRIPLTTGINLQSTYSQSSFVSTETFAGPQIMMNSGRILLNANKHEGSILLTGKNTIGLEAQRSINLSAQTDIVLDATQKVRLGGSNAQEPVLKGNETIELLNEVLVNFEQFMKAAAFSTYEVINPNTGKIEARRVEALTEAARPFALLFPKWRSRLEGLKSKKTFTV